MYKYSTKTSANTIQNIGLLCYLSAVVERVSPDELDKFCRRLTSYEDDNYHDHDQCQRRVIRYLFTYLLTHIFIFIYSYSFIHSFTNLLEMMTIDGCSGAQLLVSC